MVEDERREMGRARRLVFQNIANGVPVEKICADMRLSRLELEQAQKFVAKKIAEHLFLRRQPPIAADSILEIRSNRRALLAVLARIGDIDLSTDLILAKLMVQAIDHPEMIEGAKHRMAEAGR